MTKNLPPWLWKRAFKWFPRLTVDIVIEEANDVLLVWRDDYLCTCWHLPGGFVQLNEPVLDAVKRVAKCETGMQLKNIRFVGVYDDPERDPRGHVISLCYHAEPSGGERELTRTTYFDPTNLPPLRFGHYRMIQDAERLPPSEIEKEFAVGVAILGEGDFTGSDTEKAEKLLTVLKTHLPAGIFNEFINTIKGKEG